MKPLTLIFSLVVIAVCTACSTQTPSLSSAYLPEGPSVSEPTTTNIFVVIEEDARPFKGRSRGGTGFLAWIPLVPYGHQQVALDNVKGSQSMPREVADTVINDLRAAGIAQFIDYQNPNDPRQRFIKDPIYLHVTLNEAVWHRYVTLYGVSFAGLFLWIPGLPVSYGSVNLGFSVELKDSKGISLGSQNFKGKESVTEWLYRPFPYPSEIPKTYKQISPALREFVAEHVLANKH